MSGCQWKVGEVAMLLQNQTCLKDLPVPTLMLRMAPPVMISLLVQSIYNVVDSYFVTQYSSAALTALAIIYPVQLLMMAIATGTGVGINILLARLDGGERFDTPANVAKSGLFLGGANYVGFGVLGLLFVKSYYELSTNNQLVQRMGVNYATIIFLFAFSLFIEANLTKMLQAKGRMIGPMVAQIVGNLLNIVLNPLLIFGGWGIPRLGIRGSALATIVGQFVALVIVAFQVRKWQSFAGRVQFKTCVAIYRQGSASILLQSLYTVYIVGLNLILKRFGSTAINVLGIYYRLQAFFFIPLEGLQQVILPIVSYNFGAKQLRRIKEVVRLALLVAGLVTIFGAVIFMGLPRNLLMIYSNQPSLLNVGVEAFRVIGSSFIPAGVSMMLVVYFQATNQLAKSIWVSLTRELFLLVPLAWVFQFFGLRYFWYTFPVTEVVTTLLAIGLYYQRNLRLYLL